MNNTFNLILRKNIITGVLSGFVGCGYGNYKGILSYDNYINKKNELYTNKEINKIFDIKVLSHTLFYGSTFGIIGTYPLLAFPLISLGFIYDKIMY